MIRSVKVCRAGEVLFHHADVASGIYILESGRLRVLYPTGPNKMGPLRLLWVEEKSGSVFALSESVSGRAHLVTLQAEEDTTAGFVEWEKLLGILHQQGEFAMELVRILANELQNLYNKARFINAHPGRRPQRVPSDLFEAKQKRA